MGIHPDHKRMPRYKYTIRQGNTQIDRGKHVFYYVVIILLILVASKFNESACKRKRKQAHYNYKRASSIEQMSYRVCRHMLKCIDISFPVKLPSRFFCLMLREMAIRSLIRRSDSLRE